MNVASMDPFVAADLAAAAPGDADRLRAAQAEFAAKQAAVKAAEDQREAARQAVIEAGMTGRDDSRAVASLSAANAALADAKEVRDLRADVLEAVERQVLDAVRQRNAAPYRAKQEHARARWDQAAALFIGVFGALDELSAARVEEEEAAVGLADALRLPGHRSFLTCPDATIGLVVERDRVREAVESVPHLSDKLRRREG